MTFDQIVDLVTKKVGETDDYARERCLDFVKNRHRMIFDSFDWTAAQNIITLPVAEGTTLVEAPTAERIISARWTDERNTNNFLDPVSSSYLFESLPELIAETGVTHAAPKYYYSRYDVENQTMRIGLTPIPDADGHVLFLIKQKFDDTAIEPVLPDIEDALIAFALADMWEFMRQIGKYQAKLKEAQELLVAAQQRDTPAPPKPRTSKNLTSSGVTLVELTDSVCDIIGDWRPDIRESIKERIRRNYQLLWDMQLWPESIIVASVPISSDQQQIVLPPQFDRVIAVRTNKQGELTQAAPLRYADISLYFQVAYDIFEQSGEPLQYSILPPVATQWQPPRTERLRLVLQEQETNPAHENISVFIKGISRGLEFHENVQNIEGKVVYNEGPGFEPLPIPEGVGVTKIAYDTILTLSKPDTVGTLRIVGETSGKVLGEIGPQERERKHLRIWLLPNLGGNGYASFAGSALVCGKQRMSPLTDDGDTPQLRNVSNILINAAASDILFRLKSPELAQQLATKAQAQVQILLKAETEQGTLQPRVIPYTENYNKR